MDETNQAKTNIPLRYHIEERAPVRNRPRRFLEIFAEVLEHSNYGPVLDQFSRVTARCNRCAAACPVYEVTGDRKDIPCERSHLLLRVFERYFTSRGRLKARLFGGFELTDEHLDEMTWAYYRCTACRKCNRQCPFGVDHGLVTHLARYVLSEMDIAPKALVASVRAQLEGDAKNTSAVPLIAFKDTLEFLEDELEEIAGYRIRFPLDVEGAEYIFFAPVSDYIMEADTLMGIAAVLDVGGVSWTIGTKNFDAINYGLFYNDHYLEVIIKNVVSEAHRLKAKKILIGECGHASRTAKGFVKTFTGDDALPVVNIMEVTSDLLRRGKITLDPKALEGKKATFHDPCNVARSGWILEQGRDIVKALFPDFVEMTPNRQDNYCCGGGGGTVSLDEIKEFRMNIGGLRKVQQIQATGADYVVAPCANCKKQIGELLDYHKTGVELTGLHDLMLKALVFPKKDEDDEGGADEGGADDEGEE